MDFEKYYKYVPYIVVAVVIVLALFTLWMRLTPLSNQGTSDYLDMTAPDDPLYNFRQVDQILHDYPNYAWFDAMTLFPRGGVIYWGPLFPTLIATLCLIAGATTQMEIIKIALLTPPILAFFMVPIIFFIGKRLMGWKTGLAAAIFLAFISGQYYQRSLFGYADHHILEVVTSTVFCLGYIALLEYSKSHEVDFSKLETLKIPVILSVLTGIAYLFGLITMPTMILFAFIVTVFTVIQYVFDFYRKRSSDYLLLANVVIFTVAIIGLLIFGIKHSSVGLDLSKYTFAHVYAYLAIIFTTIGLAVTTRYLNKKKMGTFTLLLIIAGAAAVFIGVCAAFIPSVYNTLAISVTSFFGQQAYSQTVQEARGWYIDAAWAAFNYGLVLMAAGFIASIYRNYREEHPDQVYVIVWSMIILIATIQHVRYEYYLAVNIALLGAIAIGTVWEWGGSGLRTSALKFIQNFKDQPAEEIQKEAKISKRDRKEKRHIKHKDPIPTLKGTTTLLMIVVAALFVITSFQVDTIYFGGQRMNGDWREAMEWMNVSTPDTGVDYYAIYEKNNYTYPSTAYGVMSWWDYGHQITYIGHRIPNANPFQQGVSGPVGAAAYFMTESEDYANMIADTLGTRYVVTDIEMDVAKFWAMSTWYNASAATAPYQQVFLYPSQDNPEQYQSTQLFTQHYYETMISRLHNFDGSMTEANSVYYLEYVDPSVSKMSYPVLTNAMATNGSEAKAAVLAYRPPQSGYHATVASDTIFRPVDTVPALRHYRLVHESPTDVFNAGQGIPDMKYVKVFEYVKGAHIRGEGIIGVLVGTNTGRKFIYMQESQNGEFIVPYSTSGNPYGAGAISTYRILETGQEFSVSEEAVMNGLTIN